MLALVSAAFAGEAGAVAGRAEFVIGGVTIANRDGVERPLQRGTALDNGDVVRTNANGRAQIRFTDGAYVSLQPNTEFGIRDYNFQNKTDGSERGFFGLLKGAMRTVTGLIGQVNRDRYQITTPTATVGIRGTGGVIQVLDDGSTLIIGSSGIWSLTNPSGSIDVPAGTSGLSPSDPNQPPRETNQPPTSGPAPVPEPPLFVHEERTSDGGFGGLVTPLVSGSGYEAVLAYGASGSPIIIDGGEGSGNFTATFNEQGQLTEIDQFGSIYKLEAGGSHADFGTDGILAWGRWIGPVTLPSRGVASENYSVNQGFHYVIGMPTPVLPTGGTATYALVGATQPTFTDGSASPGSMTGSLNVNFGTQTVGMDLNINIANRGYHIGGDAFISGGSSFAGFANNFGQTSMTISGTVAGSCSSSCSADISGFFAGPNAERAGLGYQINDSMVTTGKDIVGAAAFKKQ